MKYGENTQAESHYFSYKNCQQRHANMRLEVRTLHITEIHTDHLSSFYNHEFQKSLQQERHCSTSKKDLSTFRKSYQAAIN